MDILLQAAAYLPALHSSVTTRLPYSLPATYRDYAVRAIQVTLHSLLFKWIQWHCLA